MNVDEDKKFIINNIRNAKNYKSFYLNKDNNY